MAGVYCCEKVRAARHFRLAPREKYVWCEAAFLKNCPGCGNAVLQLERISVSGVHSVIRYKGSRAVRTFNAMKKSILFEVERFTVGHGRFYLKYGEFGRKKRCYSNLWALKCGMFESLELPAKTVRFDVGRFGKIPAEGGG